MQITERTDDVDDDTDDARCARDITFKCFMGHPPSALPSGTRPDHKMHVCRRPQGEEGGRLKGLKGLLCELLRAMLFITNLHSIVEKGNPESI